MIALLTPFLAKGGHTFPSANITRAANFALQAFRNGDEYRKNKGDENYYPHIYNDHEYGSDWSWPCTVAWLEFPIRKNGSNYVGGFTGPYRVVVSRPEPGKDDVLCGLMSHPDNPKSTEFVLCGAAPPPPNHDPPQPPSPPPPPPPPTCTPE